MIQSNYPQEKLRRSPSASMYEDVRKIGETIGSGAKILGKELLKTTTAPLPLIGQGLGLAGGVGVSALTNPELIPYLGTGGAILGKEAGKYVREEINKKIDKL